MRWVPQVLMSKSMLQNAYTVIFLSNVDDDVVGAGGGNDYNDKSDDRVDDN